MSGLRLTARDHMARRRGATGLVVSWAGMRGVVTLVAVFVLPGEAWRWCYIDEHLG